MKLIIKIQIIVMTFLLLNSLVGRYVSSGLPEGYIDVSCFTQGHLSLDYLSLNFISFENNSVLLGGSSLFEAMGNRSAITINIDSSGPVPTSISGTILSNVAFFTASNGTSRTYYIGAYYEEVILNATTANNGVGYSFNFTNNIERAKNAMGYNGSVENVGIRGMISFDVKIENPVGIMEKTRFFNVILKGNGNLSAVTCDFTIPQVAQLKVATNGNQNMQKMGVPNRVETNIGVTPTQSLAANLYLEWEMPEQSPIYLVILYNSYFLLLLGFILGVIGEYTISWFNERRQKKSFGNKLVSELEAIKQDVESFRPINTGIYDSLTFRLLLFSDGTAEVVKRTYEEVKRSETMGYDNLQPNLVKDLLNRIDIAIDSLKKEIGKR